jgi:hypothetical protein
MTTRARFDPDDSGPGTKRRYQRISRSDGNADLHAILTGMEQLRAAVTDFLESHPEGCECDHCSGHGNDTTEYIREDLAGLGWVLGLSYGVLSSISVPLPAEMEEFAAEVNRSRADVPIVVG